MKAEGRNVTEKYFRRRVKKKPIVNKRKIAVEVKGAAVTPFLKSLEFLPCRDGKEKQEENCSNINMTSTLSAKVDTKREQELLTAILASTVNKIVIVTILDGDNHKSNDTKY